MGVQYQVNCSIKLFFSGLTRPIVPPTHPLFTSLFESRQKASPADRTPPEVHGNDDGVDGTSSAPGVAAAGW